MIEYAVIEIELLLQGYHQLYQTLRQYFLRRFSKMQTGSLKSGKLICNVNQHLFLISADSPYALTGIL